MPLTSPRSGGDMLKPADIVGHLLIVKPLEFCPNFPTNDYGPTDAVRCDVADMNATDEHGKPLPEPAVSRGVLWFNKILVSGLKLQIGDMVCGWMGQGIAKGKQDPPFQLVDAMGDPQAVAFVQQWLAAHPEFEGRPAVTGPASTPQASPQRQPLPVPGVTNYTVPGSVVTTTGTATMPPMATGNGGGLSQEQLDALKALGFVPQQ